MRPLPLLRPAPALLLACALLAACTPPPEPAGGPQAGGARSGGRVLEGPAQAQRAPETREEDVRAALQALAHDSMEGRYTGTAGMWRAANYIADRLQELGIEPAGDDGFFQRMPMALRPREGRPPRPVLLAAWPDTQNVPQTQRAVGVNVVGVLRGADPALREQAVVIGAHYDHLGVNAGPPVAGDNIWNGADDDASGVVTVLEVARALSKGPRPKRTVVFLLTTGEEEGMLGTRWYIEHPVFPLERTVADLQIEMVGRPDPLTGGRGRAWLTGFERSTMGETMAGAGIAVVADPRPAQQFFLRSDNIVFAYKGIPAHTLSSFGMHADYHRPSDEAHRIDYAHMTEVVKSAVRAARLLADGPTPVWKPGGAPEPPARP